MTGAKNHWGEKTSIFPEAAWVKSLHSYLQLRWNFNGGQIVPTYLLRAAASLNGVDNRRLLWGLESSHSLPAPSGHPREHESATQFFRPFLASFPVPLLPPALGLGQENAVLPALLLSLELVWETLQSFCTFHWNFWAICSVCKCMSKLHKQCMLETIGHCHSVVSWASDGLHQPFGGSWVANTHLEKPRP